MSFMFRLIESSLGYFITFIDCNTWFKINNVMIIIISALSLVFRVVVFLILKINGDSQSGIRVRSYDATNSERSVTSKKMKALKRGMKDKDNNEGTIEQLPISKEKVKEKNINNFLKLNFTLNRIAINGSPSSICNVSWKL